MDTGYLASTPTALPDRREGVSPMKPDRCRDQRNKVTERALLSLAVSLLTV